MDILVNPNPLTNIRVQNIANARNAILRHIHNLHKPGWDYFIMMDCDYVCETQININNLNKYLLRTDWDALSFNRIVYYDIWALSIDPYVFSCWNWPNAKQLVFYIRDVIKNQLSKLNQDELLPCYSAFNGFAIYRYEKFKDCYYNWSIHESIRLIPKELLDKNIQCVGTNPYITANQDDCEHRSFHFQAIQKNGAKIMISPLFLFGDDPEMLNKMYS